jgi:serine/threonine-protein kinase RsbW
MTASTPPLQPGHPAYTPIHGVDRFVCRAELASLPALQAWLAAVCQRERIDPAVSHDLQLIMEEASVNVMRYAYPEGVLGDLVLAVWVVQQGPRRIVLTLEDQGQPFDPLALAPAQTQAAAESRTPGGLGVHLMRQLSDHLRYRHDARRGNILTIEKWLAAAATAAHAPY